MGNQEIKNTLYDPNNPPPCNCRSYNKNLLLQICSCAAKCKECALFALKYQAKCSQCNHNYTSQDRERIRTKYQEICGNCNDLNLYFEIFYCNHSVCTICYTNNKTCPICKTGTKELEISSIEEQFCPICCNPLTNFSKNTLSCSHLYCNNCLGWHISNEIDSDYDTNQIFTKQGIKCPECEVLIPGNVVENLIDTTHLIKLIKILNTDIIECPKCSFPCEAIENTVECLCGYKYCKTCKRKELECVCEKSLQFEITDDMSICPGCKSVYLKDDKCDHVACANAKCKAEFCFNCSAFRSPTLNHGNHYHRPSCNYYENFTGNDLFVRDCTECRKSGKLCNRPSNIKFR